MTNDEHETAAERAKRTAGASGVAAAAAAAGMVAGSVAGALLDHGSQQGATPTPTARDPFDDVVPPAPTEPPVATEPTVVAETPAVPVVDVPVAEAPRVEAPATPPVAETAPTFTAVNEPAPEAPVVEAPVAEAPTTEAPVVEAPAVEPPAVEAPAVEPPVVETPVVDAPLPDAPIPDPPVVVAADDSGTVIELPADPVMSTPPPATLTDPITGVPQGGGLDPLSGGNGTDEVLVAGEPVTFMPSTPSTPIAPDPVTITSSMPDPITPDPVAPEPGWTTGSATVPLTPPPLVIEVFDGPEPSIYDVLNQAWGLVNERVAHFGQLSMQDIDADDKLEMWRAIKQLNPTLTGGPRELASTNYHDWPLTKVADYFHVDLRQLAGMVELESNENINIAEFAQQMTASGVDLGPQSITVEIDGQTIQFNANGEVAIASGPEGAFQAVELDGNVDHTPTPDSDWGWLFYIDDAEGA